MASGPKTLREILDRVLDRVGPSLKQLVYEDLERAGLCLDCEQFSIEELKENLNRMFGPEAMQLLMNLVRKHLKSNREHA